MSFQKDFPIFKNNPWLVYLDSAATLQKPSYVINWVKQYLEHDYANIHRGWYSLSEKSEELFWEARKKVATFLNASDESEVVFTSNATDSVNKLVQSLCISWMIGKWDKVLISSAEHHANIVPRQMWAERYGYEIEFFVMTHDGQVDIKDFQQKYDEKTKIVAISLVSNVFWNIVDTKIISSFIERKNVENRALLVIDASQAVPHIQVDVQALGADFLFFTGHKIGAYPWVGVLRWKQEYLKKMTPSAWGWWAIEHVSKQWYTLQGIPDKFEPGTPNLTGVVSLKLAIEYMEKKSWELRAKNWEKQDLALIYKNFYALLHELEKHLISYCLEQFRSLEELWVALLGTRDIEKKIGLFSFSLPAWKFSTQLGQYMATKNICIRCGGHCAQPLHESLWLDTGTCRISLRWYNEMSDVEKFFEELRKFLS